MDKLEKLIEKVTEQEYVELYVLYGISNNNFVEYTKDGSAASGRKWEAAKEKLDRLVDQLWAKYFKSEPCFENIMAVIKHLKDSGYKVKKSKVYADAQKRLLQAEPDGRVTELAVRAYAAGLDKKSSIRPEDIENRTVEKLQQEITRLKTQNESAQLDLDIKKGKYILRSEFEMEVAARGAVLESGLRYFFQAKAGELIDVVAGDRGRSGDFIELLNTGLDSLMNDFANTEKFQVMIMNGESEALSVKGEAEEAVLGVEY